MIIMQLHMWYFEFKEDCVISFGKRISEKVKKNYIKLIMCCFEFKEYFLGQKEFEGGL